MINWQKLVMFLFAKGERQLVQCQCTVGWNCIKLMHSFHGHKSLSHELGSEWASERMNECSETRQQSNQCRASKWASKQASGRANGPILCIDSIVILPTIISLSKLQSISQKLEMHWHQYQYQAALKNKLSVRSSPACGIAVPRKRTCWWSQFVHLLNRICPRALTGRWEIHIQSLGESKI